MSYSFGNLMTECRSYLWPSGEQSNLVAAHNKAFVDALMDLQQLIPCLQQDNITLVPQCATLYQCGINVCDAPRGRIKKVSVINSRPPAPPDGAIVIAGVFNPLITDAPTSAASIGTIPNGGSYVIEISAASGSCRERDVKAQYFQVVVQYTDNTGTAQSYIQNVYLNDCTTDVSIPVNILASSSVFVAITPTNQPPVAYGAQITVNVRTPNTVTIPIDLNDWCSEIEYGQTEPAYIQRYFEMIRARRSDVWLPRFFGLPWDGCGFDRPPRPTDADVSSSLAALPLGYHYAQPSTNRRHRSRFGLWALERQKIYILPWLQTTETIIIKWDGIKRTWAATDPVDQDPLLIKAVTEYVRWDHFQNWDKDYEAAQAAQAAYNEARTMLWHECREETRIRGDEPSFARQATAAQAGTSGVLFYNTAQTASASCPDGTGTVSSTVNAGTVASATSVADANAKALAQAQQQAQSLLNCATPTTTYLNTPQSYTAVCAATAGEPLPTGNAVTVNIPAGQYSSTVSQNAADALALQAATSQAQGELTCTWWNAAQTYTADCPTGSFGSPVTITVSAHTFSSTLSQSDADAQALTSATNQANLALVCSGSPTVYRSTIQIGSASIYCSKNGQLLTATYSTTPGQFTSTASQLAANQAAQTYANTAAQIKVNQEFQLLGCGEFSGPSGG
jgi:hypothetical protein